MASMNERGQVLILFTLMISIIIISISVLHAQNILAGMETSRTMILFPKEEIRNLKDLSDIAIKKLPTARWSEYSMDIYNQTRVLYSQKGVYGDLIIIDSGNRIIINFISGDVEYSETLNCAGGECK
ncbi:MAG: hypothetical protein NZ879_02805 [Archaeoglobaceae archaeon]|nr:hypothetical protein [Archaeoglobaceae archaeon]MDW8117895.1 hypothetical protein [Archaeoglobaceae archaeon]